MLHPVSTFEAKQSDDDERNAQELTHVEKHAVLEIYLIDFGELNEETCRENECQA